MFRNRWWQTGLLLLAAVMLFFGASHLSACDDCCDEDNCGDCQVCQCCSLTPSFLPASICTLDISTPAISALPHSAFVIENALPTDLDRPPRLLSA